MLKNTEDVRAVGEFTVSTLPATNSLVEVLTGFHFCYKYFLRFEDRKVTKLAPACKGPSLISHRLETIVRDYAPPVNSSEFLVI